MCIQDGRRTGNGKELLLRCFRISNQILRSSIVRYRLAIISLILFETLKFCLLLQEKSCKLLFVLLQIENGLSK